MKDRFVQRLALIPFVIAAIVTMATGASGNDIGQRTYTGVQREAIQSEIINVSDLAAHQRIWPNPVGRTEVPNRLFTKRRFGPASIFDNPLLEEGDADEVAPNGLQKREASRVPGNRKPSSQRLLNGGGGGPLDPIISFQGNTDIDHFIPPDTHGAVGPNHFMAVSNDQVNIYSRNGTLISSVTEPTFWSGVAPFGFDPFDQKLIYDKINGRWIFEAEDYADTANGTVTWLLVAVSQNSDPTGTWKEWRIPSNGSAPGFYDYPSVALNNKWYVAAGNVYADAGGLAVNMLVFDKADLFAFGNAKHTLIENVSGFTMQGMFSGHDNTVDDIHFIENWDDSAGTLRLSKLSGAVGSESLTTGTGFVQMPKPWTLQPDAPQPGTSTPVATNDEWRPMSLFWRNSTLWFTHCVGSLEGQGPAVIDWANINLDGSIIQAGRIEDQIGGNYYFFPSIAVNVNDDVAIGASKSGPAVFPGAVYFVRKSTDPPGTFQPEVTVKDGVGPYESFAIRWGDYSQTMVNPLDDTFWTVQEYSPGTTTPSGFSAFATWVMHFNAIPPFISLGIDPSSVPAGAGATGTVKLADPAPTGGADVAISSDDPATASGPPSVFIAEGDTTATFDITTDPNTTPAKNVTFTADYSGHSSQATINVYPFIAGIEFWDESIFQWVPALDVFGGAIVQARVLLTKPAAEGGVVVSLGTTDPEAAITTPSVTVQAGRTDQTFLVFTKPIPATEPLLVFGQAQGSIGFGQLTVHAPVPTSVTITPPTVTGGSQATGTVYLTSPAPPGGIAIALASSNTSVATVLPYAIVQQSKTSATFPIMTVPVTGTKVVQISASNEGVTRSANLTVTAPAGLLSSLVFNPSTVNGGTQAKGVVILTRPAPTGGLLVTLTKGPDPQSAIGTLPTVTVPAGYSSATFYVPTNWVPVDSTVRITATSGTSSKSANLTVRAPHVTSVTAIPVVIHSGTQTTVRVFVSGPSPTAITVPITYTGPVTGPASITVPATKTAVSFLATGTSVTASTTAKITATYPVGQSKTATITVTP